MRPPWLLGAGLWLLFEWVSGCSRDRPRQGPVPASSSPAVAARPYEMHVPPKHEARAPLLVFLHGFGGNHAEAAGHFGLRDLADAHGFLLALPDGTPDPYGKRFWNATDGCCNFSDLPVDDVAYLDALIDDALLRYPVDTSRVYVAGYSNGGFMAHRYACDRAERVAAVASFAGEPWKDASRCAPHLPVSVLQVHGDADDVVQYDGAPATRTRTNLLRGPFPGAKEGALMWSVRDKCGQAATTDQGLTETVSYRGCSAGSEVQLWTMHGMTHALPLRREEMERVWGFLAGHTRK